MRLTTASEETNYVAVTPQMAAEMLASSAGNRNIRAGNVKLFAAAMLRGEWQTSHQGIAFDRAGTLVDGHHRLHAIVQAGIAVRMSVTTGLPTNVYEVIDCGATRSYADRMRMDRNITDVIRLAAQYVTGTSKPTIMQMRQVADDGLMDYVEYLVGQCNSARRYFSSAPVKLAAALMMMVGEDADFVCRQYRALCLLDFDRMTPSAMALVRQVNQRKASANETRDTLARALRVFDSARADITKIQIRVDDCDAAVQFAKQTLSKPTPQRESKSRVLHAPYESWVTA
jgi:hypothetical protein